MSKVLVHVAERAVSWSVAADRLKADQEKARWTVFALSILGALLAALASQIPKENVATFLSYAHTALALSGAVLLGLATFISSRLLTHSKTAAWVRARAASEALKREAFKFAARVEPYNDSELFNAEALLKAEYEKVNNAVEKVAYPAADPGRLGSSPRALLTADEYRQQRVVGQAQKFNRDKAAQYRKTSKALKRTEFILAIAAIIITAIAGGLGKTFSVSGVVFDIAALTAVFTTISGTILAHIEASRFDYLVDTYTATARRLEDQDLDFDSARTDPAAWSKFVNRCEEIISAENASWVAKWSEEKA